MTFSLLLSQTLSCLAKFILYIIPCVIALLVIYFFCRVPKYVFRKCLHLVAFSCVTVMIIFAECWQAPVFASIIIIIAVYPLLSLAENIKGFSELFVQKSPGEVKRSLVMLFGIFAVITAVSWGIFGKKYAAAVSILMWGTGDAAAALVGIPWGKHKVISRFTDGHKSYEGSCAMLIVSFAVGLACLCFHGGLSFSRSLASAAAGALAGTLTELITPSEYDTITVPAAVLAVLLLLL